MRIWGLIDGPLSQHKLAREENPLFTALIQEYRPRVILALEMINSLLSRFSFIPPSFAATGFGAIILRSSL
jgi:hypothetical protein